MVELSEQVAAFDREIERTIRENGLDFEVLEGEERQEVVERLYGTFLSEKGRQARPGFVWGFLKYECDSIDCGGRDPYWSLPDVFDGDRVMYFCVPDFQDNDFLSHLRGRLRGGGRRLLSDDGGRDGALLHNASR